MIDSRHIHVSLKGEDGRNAFALSKEEIKAGGRANAYHEHLRNVSEVAEYFLAGLIDGLQDGMSDVPPRPYNAEATVMPLFCPTINSYKRLAGGAVCTQNLDRPLLTLRPTGHRTPHHMGTTVEPPQSESSLLQVVLSPEPALKSVYPARM